MDFYLFLGTVAATIFTLLGTIFYKVYEQKFRVQENQTIASSSPSSPPSPQSSLSRNWEHNVFPSFHGPDVRTGFLGHLLSKFKSKGIQSFIDNEINRGESIGPALKRAIRGSKIAIVLLSKNYASSSWCLDVLVEIMNKELGQTIMTIFYIVDPNYVKKQTGNFGKVFQKTCQGKTKEKIKSWRKALEGVATIAGYHLKNCVDEATIIDNIAADISNKLNISILSRDFDRFIGMGAHIERMESLLRLDLDEVRMVGIWGPHGIGKSTIARVLFNQVSNKFHLSAIMVNIKENYPSLGLDEGSAQLQLHKQMLSQMLDHKDMVIPHLGVAKERLKDNKVFLVLDDVDRLAQLVALAEEIQWFGTGSRIIITTEDLRVLKAHGINHIYKVAFPSTGEALQIFCTYVFGQKYPKDGFWELSWEVTYHAGKLPLGLKVLGSHFRRMSMQEWRKELPTLRTHRLDGEIGRILKFSYDALCDDDKYLFLHIACLFVHTEFEKVVEYLVHRFSDVRQRLNVLAEKSLISMEDSFIRMHSLLVELGREIVRKQFFYEPGQRQFLVDSGEICKVLNDAAGSRSVIGIELFVQHGVELNINANAFEGMSNLQFLKVHGNLQLLRVIGLGYLSPKLRLLHWDHFPVTCLSSSVNLRFLVELNMYDSELERLWEGNKLLPNLKWMNLRHSKNLKWLPNLSTATNLNELNLRECSSLVELPSSIENAINLKRLDLGYCSSLVELPFSIGNATNLQWLNLSWCSSLAKLPFSIGNATNLSCCTSLVELPSSIGNATNLQKLYLNDCSRLVKLPSSIGNVTNLEELNLNECSSLVELPSSLGNVVNLKKLNLNHCSSLVELPSSIGNVTMNGQVYLDFKGYSSLSKIHSFIGNAINLNGLDFSGCSSIVELPVSIGNLLGLGSLILRGCSKLEILPVNLKSLDRLVLRDCWSLKSFPEISTNLSYLDLTVLGIGDVKS